MLIRKAMLRDLRSINKLCNEQLLGSQSKIMNSDSVAKKKRLSDYNLRKLRMVDLLFTESLLKEKLNDKNIYFFVAETDKKEKRLLAILSLVFIPPEKHHHLRNIVLNSMLISSDFMSHINTMAKALSSLYSTVLIIGKSINPHTKLSMLRLSIDSFATFKSA